ncbi:hypothetical protein V8G54_027236 [Vigna mungo]|uniref:Uncharacterized protein n=1 Tax=Vigna mungo TaxID=3915 RepID=A0AAQ3N1T7_VIGMU
MFAERKIERSNGRFFSLRKLFVNVVVLFLGGPSRVPPCAANFGDPIRPKLAKVLLSPVLGVLGEVERVFLLRNQGVQLLMQLLHRSALQRSTEVLEVGLRVVALVVLRHLFVLVVAELEGTAEGLILRLVVGVVGFVVGVGVGVGGDGVLGLIGRRRALRLVFVIGHLGTERLENTAKG